MKKMNELINAAKKTVGKAGFQLKKHSPEILMVAGVASIVGGTVLACKATVKATEILADSKKDIEAVHECLENKEIMESGKYSEEDSTKDLTIIYTKTGVSLVKTYAPAVALTAAGVTCMLAANNILKKRNVALAAACATVTNEFKSYRKNVLERFGEKVDKELKLGIKAKEIEEVVIDAETGEQTTTTKTIDTIDDTSISSEYSSYARLFDELNPYWENDPEYNMKFLKCQERYANDLLKSRGHLFLNEVYDMLGIQRSKAGQIVGWIYDEDNPVGDNYIDFGLYRVYKNAENRRAHSAFINGDEPSIMLDFNPDGNIFDMM